jgi:uncharacterized protein (TIGR03435 family)
MTKRLLVTVALAGSAVSAVGHAQQAASAAPSGQAAPLAFEVASVKSNKSGDMGARLQRQPGGRVNAVNMPLRDLIQFAYQVRPFQIEGAPAWAATARYDIIAKAEGDLPFGPPVPGGQPPAEMLMLRTLLADRFKLAVHMETRELPIYALTLARADRKLGPQLKPSTTDCAALFNAAGRSGAPPPPPPGPGEPMQCGMRIGPGRFSGGDFSMDALANALGTMVQRPVVDRTGLSGTYQADLTFQMEAIPGPGGALIQPPPGPVDQNLPSLFTAVQEQLGLKLESTRGPVEMLVIDRVEPPVED